ncbi:MAG: 4-hydroxy-3-methylbut-2-enyl diphosphate reductase, partial [Desulfobacterales bacterium]|nr:4-hydroxy-3-methylbut-2-enyl diphosphate reductase [Desulfobacterales bacterium]
TMRLLKYVLLSTTAVLLISGAFNLISKLSFVLLLCPLFLIFVLTKHEQGYMLPGIKLEFLVESHFVMAGVIALLWPFN